MLTNEVLLKKVCPAPFEEFPEIIDLMIEVFDEEEGRYKERMALVRVGLPDNAFVLFSIVHQPLTHLKKFDYHGDTNAEGEPYTLDFDKFCSDYCDDVVAFVEQEMIKAGLMKKIEAKYTNMRKQLKNEYQRPTFADVLNIYVHTSKNPDIICYLEIHLMSKQVMLTAWEDDKGEIDLEVICAPNQPYICHETFIKRYKEGIISYLYTLVERK